MIDDDFGSSDEVKIFKDEGEDEEKEFASQEELQAALSEDKSSLIQGNSLRGIDKETFRKEEISNKNYSVVISNTLFINETKWFKIAVFFIYNSLQKIFYELKP